MLAIIASVLSNQPASDLADWNYVRLGSLFYLFLLNLCFSCSILDSSFPVLLSSRTFPLPAIFTALVLYVRPTVLCSFVNTENLHTKYENSFLDVDDF